ncbi:MAG: hypothetical protein EBS63_06530, partial [Burkholderiaceae bacterium]|nr:hypothetical protein [Burkholderiaceae bacterium]
GINVSIDPIKDQKIPRVSGSLKAHYAPNTPLHLYKQGLSDFLQSIKQGRILDQSIALVVWEDESLHDLAQLKELTKKSKLIQVPKEPIAFAHGLYRLLRLLDQSQCRAVRIGMQFETDFSAPLLDPARLPLTTLVVDHVFLGRD